MSDMEARTDMLDVPSGDPFTKYVLKSKIQESASPRTKRRIDDTQKSLKVNDQDQTKQAIRGAEWSMEYKWRAALWLELCQHLNKESFVTKNIYEESCQQLCQMENDKKFGIPIFVDRKHMYSYNLSEEGGNVCNKVLSILLCNHPEITYAPTLYSMCAIFAHYIYDETDLYCCMDSLVTANQGKLLLQTKLKFDTSVGTIIQLLKRHSRASYLYMKKLMKDSDGVKMLFRNWIWWIFRDLPFSYLVRVMDCYLSEGMKILYRIGMAIIILFHKHSGQYSSSVTSLLKRMDINHAVGEFVSKLPKTEEKLLKVAFGIRNLKASEIAALELENEMIVKSQNASSPGAQSNCNKAINLTYSGSGQSPVAQSNSIMSFEMKSSTLTAKELVSTWSWLPPRITTMKPKVVYSTNEHGCSLISFFMMAENYEPTILVIKTSNKEIIGAYCSGSWLERHEQDDAGNKKTYFATGESFLFTLAPKMHKFPWIGIKNPERVSNSNHLFMMATEEGVAIGGGGSHGLWLDKELTMGKTGHCETFDNPSLISAAHDDFSDNTCTYFTCSVVEVIGFTPS